MLKPLLLIARILVGVLFIFSGLIKANDPLGLSYKMQEFFEVWGLHGFNNYTLFLSVVMITLEIIAGVAVLLGWKMNFFSWLLLILILFFTFLTAYALFSGKIRECGCFGDCIPLQAHHSFIKDLILLGLITFIFIYRKTMVAAIPVRYTLMVLFFTLVFTFSFQWYVLQHLPVVDCLPFKVGNDIKQKMKIPPGALPDSTVITFVYDKNGKEVEFTADKFPDDFNDQEYKFLKRYDKVVRKGTALPEIRDFSLTTESGTDTTEAILSDPQYQFLVFTNGSRQMGEGWKDNFNALHLELQKENIPVHFVTSNAANTKAWLQESLGNVPASILLCDATAIKTAARVNPTFYLVNRGIVMNKWSYADLVEAIRLVRSTDIESTNNEVP